MPESLHMITHLLEMTFSGKVTCNSKTHVQRPYSKTPVRRPYSKTLFEDIVRRPLFELPLQRPSQFEPPSLNLSIWRPSQFEPPSSNLPIWRPFQFKLPNSNLLVWTCQFEDLISLKSSQCEPISSKTFFRPSQVLSFRGSPKIPHRLNISQDPEQIWSRFIHTQLKFDHLNSFKSIF